ncbi:MAG: DUF4198 domain-containing protein [Betaproteobacteria bacterium]|nr:DUF4198 domain-containing protein [Betaproteobacteria bacterium]
MKAKAFCAASLACLVGAAAAQHEHHAAAPAAPKPEPAAMRAWTQQPLLLPGRMERGERASAMLRPQGLTVERVTVYASGGPAERLKVDYAVGAEGAKIESVTPKIGNYHWVVAREERGGEVRVASAAWYFGNPGDSPKDLLKAVRHELEIVPEPLPREHSSYRESEKWRFLVRLNGQPLPGHPLMLETEFGSRSTFVTDPAGVATVLFPRDFKPAAAGERSGHGPRRAAFVLSTTKDADGRRYLTAFNHKYGQDGDRDKSLGWGAAFGLVGMAAALPLLRRRNKGDNGNA